MVLSRLFGKICKSSLKFGLPSGSHTLSSNSSFFFARMKRGGPSNQLAEEQTEATEESVKKDVRNYETNVIRQKISEKKLSNKEQISLLQKQGGEDRELTREEIRSLTRAEQRDKDMAMNIINEETLGDYDKKLDETIDKQIKAGASMAEIIKLLQGNVVTPQQQDQEEDSMIKDNSGKFGFFEQNPTFKKQAEAMGQLYDIIDKDKERADKLKLTELPVSQHVKLNRKLTDEEKFTIQSRMASVGAYVASPYSDPKNIPSEILQPRVFESGDPQRMTKVQQQEFLTSIQEQAMDQYDEEKDQKRKKKTIIAQKLHAMEVDQKEDERFRALVEGDSKQTELQVDCPTEGDKRQLARDFADPKRNTFLIQDKQLESAAKAVGLDMSNPDDENSIDVLRDISKEALFHSKRLSEEQAEFQKKLERRKRIKELRKFEQSLNLKNFKQDIDYADPNQNFKGDKVPKHEEYSDIPDLKKLKELQDKYNDMMEFDTRWDVHKKRSMRRISEFVREKLASAKGNIRSVTLFRDIRVDKIVCNPSMTVIYIFWSLDEAPELSDLDKLPLEEQMIRKAKNMMFRYHEEEKKQRNSANIPKLNSRLNSFGKELSGMMCRELGFKYGPDMRFAVSKNDERSSKLKTELAEVIPDIMQKQLLEKFEKGEIPQKISKAKMAQELDRKLIDLEEKMFGKIESDEALIAQAKAESKPKKDEEQIKKERLLKRMKNQRDSDGNRNRTKKKRDKKAADFWESLDAY